MYIITMIAFFLLTTTSFLKIYPAKIHPLKRTKPQPSQEPFKKIDEKTFVNQLRDDPDTFLNAFNKNTRTVLFCIAKTGDPIWGKIFTTKAVWKWSSLRDENGRTLLHQAVLYSKNLDLVKTIVSLMGDINGGTTPLYEAIEKSDHKKLAQLLDGGMDPNGCADQLGATPYGLAKQRFVPQNIKAFLLEKDAQLESPLSLAYDLEDRTAITLLLKHGASLIRSSTHSKL